MSRERYPTTGRDVPYPPDDPDTERPDHPLPTPPPNPDPPPPFPVPPAVPQGPAEKGVVIQEPTEKGVIAEADVATQLQQQEEEDEDIIGADFDAVHTLREPLNTEHEHAIADLGDAEPEHAVTDTKLETAGPGFIQEIVTMNGFTTMNDVVTMNGFTPDVVEENDGADTFARDEFPGDIATSG